MPTHVVLLRGVNKARLLGRTVYLHTPDGYPPSELRRALARAGGAGQPPSPQRRQRRTDSGTVMVRLLDWD